MIVRAADYWPTNGHLIEDVARLGHLHVSWPTLDPTYGKGVWWRRFRPHHLVASDLNPEKSPVKGGVDFTDMPWGAGEFRAVAIDGPYKLNGTPDVPVDSRWGVDLVASWQARIALIELGMVECVRVLERKRRGRLLVKCQDQVCSGAVRWQTRTFADHAEKLGCELLDRFDMLGTSRPQPMEGTHRFCRACDRHLGWRAGLPRLWH